MLKLKLGQIMRDKNINTRQLSELSGVRWNTVRDMEQNVAKHWSPENLEKIMLVLGITEVSQLFEYSTNEGSGE